MVVCFIIVDKGNYLNISEIKSIMEGLKQNTALKELNMGC